METLYIQTFLNFPEVIRCLFQIVQICKTFCGIISRIEYEDQIDYRIESEIRIIDQKFNEQVMMFIRLVNHLNQAGSTNFLGQLWTRLTFNNYFSHENSGMEIEGI